MKRTFLVGTALLVGSPAFAAAQTVNDKIATGGLVGLVLGTVVGLIVGSLKRQGTMGALAGAVIGAVVISAGVRYLS